MEKIVLIIQGESILTSETDIQCYCPHPLLSHSAGQLQLTWGLNWIGKLGLVCHKNEENNWTELNRGNITKWEAQTGALETHSLNLTKDFGPCRLLPWCHILSSIQQLRVATSYATQTRPCHSLTRSTHWHIRHRQMTSLSAAWRHLMPVKLDHITQESD